MPSQPPSEGRLFVTDAVVATDEVDVVCLIVFSAPFYDPETPAEGPVDAIVTVGPASSRKLTIVTSGELFAYSKRTSIGTPRTVLAG